MNLEACRTNREDLTAQGAMADYLEENANSGNDFALRARLIRVQLLLAVDPKADEVRESAVTTWSKTLDLVMEERKLCLTLTPRWTCPSCEGSGRIKILIPEEFSYKSLREALISTRPFRFRTDECPTCKTTGDLTIDEKGHKRNVQFFAGYPDIIEVDSLGELFVDERPTILLQALKKLPIVGVLPLDRIPALTVYANGEDCYTFNDGIQRHFSHYLPPYILNRMNGQKTKIGQRAYATKRAACFDLATTIWRF